MKKKTKKIPAKQNAKKWKVEHRFSYGWDDAGWTVEDVKTRRSEPQRFDFKADANAEIREHIKDQHQAFKAGDMDEKYSRSDYRAVPA